MNKTWIAILGAAGFVGIAYLFERKAHAYGEDPYLEPDQSESEDPNPASEGLYLPLLAEMLRSGITIEQLRNMLPAPPSVGPVSGLGTFTKPAEGFWQWPIANYKGLVPDISSGYGDERTNALRLGKNGKMCKSAGVDSDGNADDSCSYYIHEGVDLDFMNAAEFKLQQPPFRSAHARSTAFIPPGTPALAVAGGRIKRAGLCGKRGMSPFTTSGMRVAIDHGNRIVTSYLHLKPPLFPGIVEGADVAQGQPLGIISNDPGAKGVPNNTSMDETKLQFDHPAGGTVHLHFEVQQRGVKVNPMKLLAQARRVKSESALGSVSVYEL